MSYFSYAKVVLILVILTISCSSSSPQAANDLSKKLHILFIGNSLTYFNDLPGILEELLKHSEFKEVKIESVTLPNYGLQDHWINNKTRTKIAENSWNVVVLQQGPSATEGRPSLLEYSQKFAEEIKKIGGTTAMYMVWPANSRSYDFDGVSDSYQTAAELVDGILFPAGEAWREAWKKDETLELYGSDGFHPSLTGSYLAALVMFNQLTTYNIYNLPASIPTPNGSFKISIQLAKLLQDSAMEANAKFAR